LVIFLFFHHILFFSKVFDDKIIFYDSLYK